MKNPLISLFSTLLYPIKSQFYQALQSPDNAQKFVQVEIFNRLIKSEYGQFIGVDSIEQWQQIPIVEYDKIEAWIQEQQADQTSLLTSEPILFYEKTSGSRGCAKLIPYTKSLRHSFNQMFCVWAYDLIVNGPKFSTGKTYFCISPQLGKTTTDPGITVGLKDDSEYLDHWVRICLSPFLVSPPGIDRLQNAEEFKQRLCSALLETEALEIISIWSPSFLRVQLDYIETNREFIRYKLMKKISAARSRLLLEPEIPWTEIWPQLKLISCWDSGNSADGASFLRSRFPNVMVQGKGLLATEAPMTIPLIPAKGCVPVLTQVFFEFEDDRGEIYLLHELQIGKIYNIILSQKGGLYRYRIGDHVRVTHYYLQTPCLEFLGRNQSTSDLVGEKLHETFIQEILHHLSLENSFFKSLVSVSQPTPYYLLLLDTAPESPRAIAQKLEAALMESPQYQQARLLGQLAAVRVLISPQIPEAIALHHARSGIKWGNYKYPILSTKPIEPTLLAQLRQNAQERSA